MKPAVADYLRLVPALYNEAYRQFPALSEEWLSRIAMARVRHRMRNG